MDLDELEVEALDSGDNSTTPPPEKPKLTVLQWDLISYCEEFWHEFRAFPNYTEIRKHVRGYSSDEEVEEALYLPIIRERLNNRGITYSAVVRPGDEEYSPTAERLTDKQFAVISTLLNPLDQRTKSKKLEELGVRPAQLNGWMKSKRFADYFARYSEDLFKDGIPIAHGALMDRVAAGDMKAIKLFYEVSGRHTGVNKQETANLQLVLVKLIEIMQRHCDPATMQAINYEISLLMGNSAPPTPRTNLVAINTSDSPFRDNDEED